MKFSPSLLRGTLIKRYKRFLADVELDNGAIVTAHCPNTGAMTGCAEPGYTVYLSESTNPNRKLKYTWELAQTFDGHFIGINTHNANKLVAEALDNKVLDQFSDITSWKAEVTPPLANSRFDFQLMRKDTQLNDIVEYMEVKSVTLANTDKGFFPDAVTQRGAKHCLELARLAESGVKTTLLFCVQHTAIKSVQVATHIDPTYAKSVKIAANAGVTVSAAGCIIDEQKILLNQTLPLIL
ncbi:DNA/RNA nuclease SfsA [Alteromonas marina]|uniref:DNA/RNA nuclease SfsA n=1 Tax=unclassified Alteromonas TaxID=2614992 RepID=UPI0012E410E1|nr:DNA/RNA nuclease SfsA [Alteromonas sp. KUL150]GFD75740.1 sugar fermentation stimulation protein [Tenacibaculum sp. KUL113]GFD86211.1 sugar fermentation stimulation protein [Alteromonas sp. KUL150]